MAREYFIGPRPLYSKDLSMDSFSTLIPNDLSRLATPARPRLVADVRRPSAFAHVRLEVLLLKNFIKLPLNLFKIIIGKEKDTSKQEAQRQHKLIHSNLNGLGRTTALLRQTPTNLYILPRLSEQ